MLAFLRSRRFRLSSFPALPTRSFNGLTGNKWLETYMSSVNRLFREISEDRKIDRMVLDHWIDKSSWSQFINTFRRRIIKEPIVALGSEELTHLTIELDKLIENQNDSEAIQNMKTYLVENIILPRAEVELADVINSHRTVSTAADLRMPHEWYPKTRLMKRKIIYHGGPTNSGKTYQALKRLAEADPEKGGGLYCGPLRLLALEVYDKLNRQGVLTNLFTGQEKREVPGATHISSTVEMVSITREYDVVVIDEIQMIGDKTRGHAWTRAVLGLRAREIHVCGGLEALQIVEALAAETGDDFVLEKYDRLSTLKIEEESLRGDYSKVKPGDCIVAFSKVDIFSIRQQIEATTNYKCAVIYGGLPPETRTMQARLFNEENTGFDILVASDAIGMGLNLNIGRIIFHTVAKMLKDGVEYMDSSSIKQIAGRAGRMSSKYEVGLVTAWQEVDLAHVRGVMKWDVPQITTAGVFPSVEQVEQFSTHMDRLREIEQQQVAALNEEDEDEEETHSQRRGNNKSEKAEIIKAPAARSTNQLSTILSRFVTLSQLEGRYHLSEHRDMIITSNWLQPIPLSIADRFTFANAPANLQSSVAMACMYEFAAKYALKQPVALNITLSKDLPKTFDDFSELCNKHNVLDLYVWLSHRFPKYFIEQDNCTQQKNFALKQIEEYLVVAHANATEQTYRHNEMYLKIRQKLALANIVPAQDFPHIHSSIMDNMAAIEDKDMYVLPEGTAVMPRKRFSSHGGRSSSSSSARHDHGYNHRRSPQYDRPTITGGEKKAFS